MIDCSEARRLCVVNVPTSVGEPLTTSMRTRGSCLSNVLEKLGLGAFKSSRVNGGSV